MTQHDPSDDAPVPPGHLRERTTSLEMLRCPLWARALPAMPEATRVDRVARPTVAFYRFLYATVGEPWLWCARRSWTDEKLLEHIHAPANEIWLLVVDGQPAGFGELDRRIAGTVELSYFGLMPEFIGRKLGRPLLRYVIHKAWAGSPSRVWVHTCDLDHPAALGLYQREGFLPFRQHDEIVPDPRASGLVPRGVQPQRPIKEP